MALLEVDSLCAAPYGAPLLRDLSFRLEAGETLGLIGPNGAGKSSLLHCLAGGLPVASGGVELAGRPLRAWPRAARSRLLALQGQHSGLNFPFTVEEVILLGRIPHTSGRAADRDVLEEVLRATDTAGLRGRPYTQLSGGEKQRVQLARAVAQVWRSGDAPARVLLLDEPSAALDLAHQRMVLEVVAGLAREGCGVIVASHDCNLLGARVDRMLVMHAGEQYTWGAPAAVLTEAMFRAVFAVPVQVSAHPRTGRPLVIPP